MNSAYHNIPPIYGKTSKILILGSFPSVKSREEAFFYAHPQNRFWAVIASVYGCETPKNIDEKKSFLFQNDIALWDVIASCNIKGSSDVSITDAVPNDLSIILNACSVTRIYVNGRTAEKHYVRFQLEKTGISARLLPSTSPANAAWTLEKLKEAWKKALTEFP